jgi:hypothetical protein
MKPDFQPDGKALSAGATGMSRRTGSHSTEAVRVPLVFLEFTESPPQSVCIAGTFNDWRPEVTRMTRMGDGYWVKVLSLPPGYYEYRVVVDREWIPDPLAEHYVRNPFGGINSLLAISSRTSPKLAGRLARRNMQIQPCYEILRLR